MTDIRENPSAEEEMLFLDTNTFLHFRPIEEIDWKKLTSAQKIKLVVAPIIIQELDRKKYDASSSKIRQRANASIKKLSSYAQQEVAEIAPGVQLSLLAQENYSDISGFVPDLSNNDDRLLATLLSHSNKGRKCRIVTADLGLKIKAKLLKIPVIHLDDQFKLPNELDEDEKKIRELERELLNLKTQMPDLDFKFEGGEEVCSFKVTQLSSSFASKWDELRQKNRERNKRMVLPSKIETGNSGFDAINSAIKAMNSLNSISKADIDTYNAELEKYYLKFDKWVEDMKQYEMKKNLIFPLKLIVSNAGTAKAEDIDVIFHIPDGISVFSERDLPESPEKPDAPEKPVPGVFRGLNLNYQPPMMDMSLLRSPIVRLPSNVTFQGIKPTNSFEVSFHIKNLKHGFDEHLDTIYISFADLDSAKSFSIQYSLLAGNIPKAITGELHVRIDK